MTAVQPGVAFAPMAHGDRYVMGLSTADLLTFEIIRRNAPWTTIAFNVTKPAVENEGDKVAFSTLSNLNRSPERMR